MLRGATKDYIRLHRVTWGYTELNGSTQLHGGTQCLNKATQGFMGLHRITYSYTGLHKASTQGYMWLQK